MSHTSKKNQEPSLFGKCVAEFLGTGLLIFFGVGCVAGLKLASANLGQWEVSIIWGLAVALAVYLTAGVSGAHLNPAVTLALCLFANFKAKMVLPYIAAQLLGAFSAAALVYGLYYNLFMDYELSNQITRGSIESLNVTSIFSTYPHPKITLIQSFLVEFVITTVLMSLILALNDDGNGLPKGSLAPLLVGLLIAVIGASMGPLTGFAMNPARDFGPKLFTYFAGYGSVTFTGGQSIPYFIIPVVAPILGASFGAFMYRFCIAKFIPIKA